MSTLAALLHGLWDFFSVDVLLLAPLAVAGLAVRFVRERPARRRRAVLRRRTGLRLARCARRVRGGGSW